MIHCCESYPDVNALKKFIEGELLKADHDGQVDDYDDVEITYQQWTTSGRAELISCTLPLDEFIEQLYEHKDIFACLFSIHNIISLSCHEQVCLQVLVHDMINLLY